MKNVSFLRKPWCITLRNQPVQTGVRGYRTEDSRMDILGETTDGIHSTLWDISLRGIV